MTISEFRRKALEYYEGHPERWTQGFNARDSKDEACPLNRPEVACMCLFGFCYSLGSLGESSHLVSKLEREADIPSLVKFNDDPLTTFEDVISLLKSLPND